MQPSLSVAVPWSLSHYIPLNGFHPLYQALFESSPNWVQLEAWDNIELSHKLHSDRQFRRQMIRELEFDTKADNQKNSRIDKEYFSYFTATNRYLTCLLPGDIEFLHTAPYPSLERPFVFHFESFAPVFFPFAHQGTGKLEDHRDLRSYYKTIFEHPLCLGIFSHLQHSLEEVSKFFGSSLIDDRLFASRIGFYNGKQSSSFIDSKGPLNSPVFLFINSANQNPGNFFLRGGHLALSYWKAAFTNPGDARLFMRCKRPNDELLADYGVDLDWLKQHERRSVIWIEDYLSGDELNVLMQAAHFLLLPSYSLHSVSIMQAMAAGAVPVVSDTLGTSRFVADAVDGIILKGMRSNNWKLDANTGVMFDCYERNCERDRVVVQQLVSRISALIASPSLYSDMQVAAMAKAGQEFSGKAFSEDFWQKVRQKYLALPESKRKLNHTERNRINIINRNCLVNQSDWARIFASSPQPFTRLNTGRHRVIELGGAFTTINNNQMDLNDWSPLENAVNNLKQTLIFKADIKGLDGNFLGYPTSYLINSTALFSNVKNSIAEKLIPFPVFYSMASALLKYIRRIYRLVKGFLPLSSSSKKSNISDTEPNIQLVKENIKGFNIIRCDQLYYALPQSAGAFSQARAAAGDYELFVSGSSLRVVLRRLSELPDMDSPS